jgi:hypothetical protein
MWHVRGDGRCKKNISVGIPGGCRKLRRPRRRWEDNIKICLQELGLRGTDWFYLAQDRYRRRALVNAVMNHRVP